MDANLQYALQSSNVEAAANHPDRDGISTCTCSRVCLRESGINSCPCCSAQFCKSSFHHEATMFVRLINIKGLNL